MKKAKNMRFLALAIALVCTLSLAGSVAAQEDKQTYMPLWMQPHTVIVYDDDLNYTILQGGELTEDDLIGREDIAAVGLTSESSEMLASPNTKVEYDLHGFVQNVFYPTPGRPGEYQLSDPAQARVNSGIIDPGEFHTSDQTYYNYDTQRDQYCTLTRSTDGKRMTGVGQITMFSGAMGEGGTHVLSAGDCATKKKVDDVAAGTPITAKNQVNGKSHVYYKYDVGRLPAAILDIWYGGGANPITYITNTGAVDNVYSGVINHAVP